MKRSLIHRYLSSYVFDKSSLKQALLKSTLRGGIMTKFTLRTQKVGDVGKRDASRPNVADLLYMPCKLLHDFPPR